MARPSRGLGARRSLRIPTSTTMGAASIMAFVSSGEVPETCSKTMFDRPSKRSASFGARGFQRIEHGGKWIDVDIDHFDGVLA